MASKIFINYRRDEPPVSFTHAVAIAEHLGQTFGKRNIFIDVDDDHMRAGVKFRTVLEAKLRQCKVMLAIIGPNWVDTRDEKTGSRRIDDPEDWVRVEIERALARSIPVIPVLVAGARLPSKSDLPPTLQPLIEHQCAAVTTTGFSRNMTDLARDVAYLPVRRWGRMVAAASALILGSYMVAHQFGAPVWWPSFAQGRPNVVEAPSQKSPSPALEAAKALPFRVHFKLANSGQMEQARALRSKLQQEQIDGKPILVPSIEIKSREPKSVLRCFTLDECKYADSIVMLMRMPNVGKEDLSSYPSQSKGNRPLHYEL